MSRYTRVCSGGINFHIVDGFTKPPTIVDTINIIDYANNQTIIEFSNHVKYIKSLYNTEFFAYDEEITEYLYGKPVATSALAT